MTSTPSFEKLRMEKKALKAAKKAKDITRDPSNEQKTVPMKRLFRSIPIKNVFAQPTCTLSVMTYNILAQNLVKRELFPYSGSMLKWKTRRRMVYEDIAQYQPDIMCLQEVDYYKEYYHEAFDKLGYTTEFFKHPKKQHGCMIGYKSNIFERIFYNTLEYDQETLCSPMQFTGNIAQYMALQHIQHKNIGVVVGNTHLYWRPESYYEKFRQAVIYGQQLTTMAMDVRTTHPYVQWTVLAAGDLNTCPEDPVYSALTQKTLSKSHWKILEASRRKFGEEEEEEEASLLTLIEMTPQALMEETKNILPLKSIYSCYGEITNASEPKGEPKFTNYASVYRGTLDYLMLENTTDYCHVTELLEIPEEEYLKPALPNMHFGSDHVCLVAKLEFTI
ncbi:Endonuclease/exonuclease/phosphatase [Spinellus fusiger]|nr:Endonuclease/exonuclease/phosphatase [Spinellus fusiger]